MATIPENLNIPPELRAQVEAAIDRRVALFDADVAGRGEIALTDDVIARALRVIADDLAVITVLTGTISTLSDRLDELERRVGTREGEQ